jgi:hypothetical protein
LLHRNAKAAPKTSLARRAVGALLVSIIFLILGRVLYLNVGALRHYEWHFQLHLLFASFLFLSLNYVVAAYVWTLIVKMLGRPISFSQSFCITYLSASGKYIPGRIWTYLGRVYLAAKAGLPGRLTLVSMVLMFVTYNGIAAVFFLCTLLLWEEVPKALAVVLILLFSSLLLLVLHPTFLRKVTNFFLRLFRKEELELEVSRRKALCLLGLLLLDRLVFSTFAYLFVNSFMNLGLITAVKLSGVFSVAVLLGMLAFIVPAGLGVREGVQTYLLSWFVPVPAAVLIPLALRVCMTSGELICFGIALRIRKAGTLTRDVSGREYQTAWRRPGDPAKECEVPRESVEPVER